jgi:hypothetical protein
MIAKPMIKYLQCPACKSEVRHKGRQLSPFEGHGRKQTPQELTLLWRLMQASGKFPVPPHLCIRQKDKLGREREREREREKERDLHLFQPPRAD